MRLGVMQRARYHPVGHVIPASHARSPLAAPACSHKGRQLDMGHRSLTRHSLLLRSSLHDFVQHADALELD